MIVYDQNMPAIEQLLGGDFSLRPVNGRALGRTQLLDAQALLVRSVTRVDAALLEGTPVRFVGSATSGLDHVDRHWLAEQGIAFGHAPGANANSVVEYVLAAVGECDDYLERLLAGSRVGIVGYGCVGQTLARRLDALGIAWCASDPWLPGGTVPNAAALDEVLACDVICLHPELTREQPWPSFHLLGEVALRQLREGQLLVNASRGPVIDNSALLRRLQQPSPPTVVLDVWEGEPRLDPRLLREVRLGTPHIAGYSLDSKLRASAMVAEALRRCFGAPAPVRPVTSEAAALQLPAGPGSADRLRQLLAHSYRIDADDRQLRQTVLSGDPEGEGFDRLRRDYGDRRELAGRAVRVAAGDEAGRRLVLAMDCIPVTGEV